MKYLREEVLTSSSSTSASLAQAWARMLLAGQAHSRARRASTTLASAWRMRSEVMTKKKAISDVITLQVILLLHLDMHFFMRPQEYLRLEFGARGSCV